MPDQLCLSLWLRDFDGRTMFRHFRTLLRLFPFSQLRPGIAALRVYAIEFAEPALSEQAFAEAVDADTVIKCAREFQEPDCAWLIDGWWELWLYQAAWQLAPSPVVLTCFGPQFENELGDNLRLELGPEERFLPVAGAPQGVRKAQSNLASLARLAYQIGDRLPVERQKLWSESGEDFAERLETLADEAG
jgi:hypothetical protein